MAEIQVYDARELDRQDWLDLQTIEREAFYCAPPSRSREEIDALVGWNDPTRYYHSHVDPNVEVGSRYSEGQAFSRPKVAVAIKHNEPVGFAYAANNVSGESVLEIAVKRLTVVRNYFWLREIAVHPNSQGQSLALGLGAALLKQARPRQRPVAYVWPSEMSTFCDALGNLGFTSTGEEQVDLYDNGKKIKQVRMQARSAQDVLDRLGEFSA